MNWRGGIVSLSLTLKPNSVPPTKSKLNIFAEATDCISRRRVECWRRSGHDVHAAQATPTPNITSNTNPNITNIINNSSSSSTRTVLFLFVVSPCAGVLRREAGPLAGLPPG